MNKFNGKRYAGLCRLQMKENTVLCWTAPFLFMALVLIAFNIGVNSPEEWLEGIISQVSIYFNFGILAICTYSFERFFKKRNGVCKLMLPGTYLEKWASIWSVALLQFLYWFVLCFLADGIMLWIGTQNYDIAASTILQEYQHIYTNPAFYIFYLVLFAGISFLAIIRNTTGGFKKLLIYGIILFAAFCAAYYLLPKEATLIVYVIASIALLAAEYFIFKKTTINMGIPGI